MGRDPNDPQLIDSDKVPVDPKKLHKYLYAGGDPVNRVDPSGRAEILQFVFTTADISSPVTAFEYGYAVGVATAYACYANTIYALLHWAYTSEPLGPLDFGCLVVAGGSGP